MTVAPIIIDACCVINLAAADAFETWLPRLGLQWMVPQAVVDEALFLRVLDEHGDPGRELIDLGRFIACGLLDVVVPESDDELAAYVAYAIDLDDGEAMALCLAKSRGWTLATDDRRALVLAESASVPVLGTPDILKRWVDSETPDPPLIAETLFRIKQRARYLPGPRSPLFDWWMAYLPASTDR